MTVLLERKSKDNSYITCTNPDGLKMMQTRCIFDNSLAVSVIFCLFQAGYTDNIICGVMQCDTSVEYCDVVLEDCVNCECFCHDHPQHCQTECPIYFNGRTPTITSTVPQTDSIVRTPSSTHQSSTPVQNFIGKLEAADTAVLPPNHNLGLILFVAAILVLSIISVVGLLFWVVRVRYRSRRHYRRTRETYPIGTFHHARPNRITDTRRAEVSKKLFFVCFSGCKVLN